MFVSLGHEDPAGALFPPCPSHPWGPFSRFDLPIALSTLSITTPSDEKSPHPVICKRSSADTGALELSSDLKLVFLKLLKRPMM